MKRLTTLLLACCVLCSLYATEKKNNAIFAVQYGKTSSSGPCLVNTGYGIVDIDYMVEQSGFGVYLGEDFYLSDTTWLYLRTNYTFVNKFRQQVNNVYIDCKDTLFLPNMSFRFGVAAYLPVNSKNSLCIAPSVSLELYSDEDSYDDYDSIDGLGLNLDVYTLIDKLVLGCDFTYMPNADISNSVISGSYRNPIAGKSFSYHIYAGYMFKVR
ncbi:MAG: hypothetical protein MJZ25_12995 [Fibrobacter sp.]|nr:hypothetical protein [Fibrobacter sp.]